MKQIVQTDQAPKAIGPYSQAQIFDNTLWCSGQLGIDPQTGELVSPAVEDQAKQALLNIKAILKAQNYELDQIVKTTIFLADIADFPAVNTVYASFFTEPYPARSTIQVAALPKGGKVEIEVIAVK